MFLVTTTLKGLAAREAMPRDRKEFTVLREDEFVLQVATGGVNDFLDLCAVWLLRLADESVRGKVGRVDAM